MSRAPFAEGTTSYIRTRKEVFFYIVTLRGTINNIRGLRLSKPRPMRTNKINLQIIYNGKEPETNHTALSFYYNKER